MSQIPLYAVHMPPNIASVLSTILGAGQVAGGPNVSKFEDLLRTYIGTPLITTTGEMSTSLAMCLFLAGVRPGDEVLMSPLVCLAASCPVRNLFATVRWCDVDPRTGNLDPSKLAERITPKTKAILVYHWAGYPADLEAVYAVAQTHHLAVIEDASESLGAEYHGKRIGCTGSDYTVFSFYPNRHLTTIEGAAIAFAREEDYEHARWLKRYGIHQPSFRDKDGEIDPASDIPVAGWNTYMNHVAATIGVEQMAHLDSIVSRHQQNGLYYDRELAQVPGVTVLEPPQNSLSAYWVYTFLVPQRDRLLRRLRQRGIYASKVHLRNDLYTGFGGAGIDLPGVDHFSQQCLSIPCGWWVTEEGRTLIVDVIREEVARA